MSACLENLHSQEALGELEEQAHALEPRGRRRVRVQDLAAEEHLLLHPEIRPRTAMTTTTCCTASPSGTAFPVVTLGAFGLQP